MIIQGKKLNKLLYNYERTLKRGKTIFYLKLRINLITEEDLRFNRQLLKYVFLLFFVLCN